MQTIEEIMASEATKLYFLSPNAVAVYLEAVVSDKVERVRIERAWHGIPMSWSIVS